MTNDPWPSSPYPKDEARSAAIRTVDGSAGFVLDRSAEMPEDRFAAALEILEFYGWDTSQLERVQ